MKAMIKKIPFAQQGYRIFRNLFALYSSSSYSQEGEDLILKRIFEGQKRGFYVDIGAHHPYRFSNTFLFYKQGWNGINIDAMPNSMRLFKLLRPRDINIESPIGKDQESLQYFSFNEPALNTFDQTRVEKILQNPSYKLLKTYTLKINSLDKILSQHIKNDRKIDFMSIDVEGLDLEVLQSNDWTKYRPKILLVEKLSTDSRGGGIQEILSSPLHSFLESQQYEFFAKTFNTLFFKDKEQM
ncbi:hypothetical protein BBW65_01225 [Helicobacter enhydrae]|uniref:Methyltransferase FkbM domain-containing protein n=1 Tax=Helicobacter enhydrae TaxID=222136 RepID=A0A1B1U427_9HELI|nr:FkbM family methyltransferase [Helicobacter enhydrae]ANV97513.1 hypothetical protein BBW65_01225 [Helicobacter enhydrae]